jgi:hypothetical protein
MFEDSGCSWGDYLGPRNNSDLYETYLDFCLNECFNLGFRSGLASSALGVLLLCVVMAVGED